MKKSCYGCKALDDSFQAVCGLGFRIKTILDETGKGRDLPVPDQECPKPATIKKFVELASTPKHSA